MYKNSIVRDRSLLDINYNLEHLHTFKNVPASMACTSQEEVEDIFMNQTWDICKNTGLIQLRKLFPLELVYKFPHNDGVGEVWNNHDKALCDFIETTGVKKVLEIGGGAGRLGKLFLTYQSQNRLASSINIFLLYFGIVYFLFLKFLILLSLIF